MSASGFALFETSIGPCGIAWGERGLRGLQLPEASEAASRARLRKRFPGAEETTPPREVQAAIRAMTKLLAGGKADLDAIVLDMDDVSPFHRRVYEAARRIPAGRTWSYGEVAKKLGSPKSARAVGQALGRNPFPIVVPCHRVLASGGKSGGFTAEGGVATKMRMLAIEGAAHAKQTKTEPAKASGARKRATATAVAPKDAELAKDAKAPAPGELDLERAVRELRAADPVLAKLIDRVGACRYDLNATQSIFAALAEAIVYQQLTGKAAATIHGRVCALFPRAKAGYTPKHLLGVSEEALRGCGLSRAKTAALRDLAQKAASGDIPTLAKIRTMSDEDIIEKLTAVRGVGRWTTEMLLMFRLGRPDVLPADDYGVRKGYAHAYGKRDLPTRKQLERAGEKWKPWRSVASWYLWRAADEAARRTKK